MSEENKEKQDHPNSNIVGRDQIIQHGDHSAVHISNKEDRAVRSNKLWSEKWWGVIVLGVIMIMLGALVTNYFHLTIP